ncbi:hypothetical protein FC72_GL001931 [Companilactobacillus tucceti DSM 20183]|uniref:DUF1659 domain-containing protein n=1 Tax=Companilactobacillus tucceti DSM 20183 TaxID=1423811 RepID=A0A0R1J0Y2_9LACO|nr:hypothetical protein [Companilactobacillus tucceti]KRK64876.1 hypothetical protein FC72_GL001931 [Companilactobacillus tucceti DSM 20183]
MDWEKTSINLTMTNDKYAKGKMVRSFNNIVANPTKEQIDLLVEGLIMLSDGDAFLKAEIIKHDAMVTE